MIREQILSEIRTRALTVPELAGKVYRSAVPPEARKDLPSLYFRPVNDRASRQTSVRDVDRLLIVRFFILVQADVADQVAAPIQASLHKALLPTQVDGSIDTRLGMEDYVVNMDLVGDSFELAYTEGAVVTDYEVQYRHSEGDLAA